MSERVSPLQDRSLDSQGFPRPACECEPAYCRHRAIRAEFPLTRRLGAALRARRESLNLSQEAVARRVGRTQTWLSYVEAGKREPSLDDLDELTRLLGMAIRIEVVRD